MKMKIKKNLIYGRFWRKKSKNLLKRLKNKKIIMIKIFHKSRALIFVI